MELKALVESLLFVADRPATVDELAAALQADAGEIKDALQELSAECRARGVRLQHQDDRWQMVSAPEAAPYVERFLGLEVTGKLSPAAMETLSIVAYRQPVTRAQVEAIRGVNSGGVLRSLVRRGLIAEVGRAETAGRPILYGTTFEFLQLFGLQSPQDLPKWEEIERALRDKEAASTTS